MVNQSTDIRLYQLICELNTRNELLYQRSDRRTSLDLVLSERDLDRSGIAIEQRGIQQERRHPRVDSCPELRAVEEIASEIHTSLALQGT